MPGLLHLSACIFLPNHRASSEASLTPVHNGSVFLQELSPGCDWRVFPIDHPNHMFSHPPVTDTKSGGPAHHPKQCMPGAFNFKEQKPSNLIVQANETLQKYVHVLVVF